MYRIVPMPIFIDPNLRVCSGALTAEQVKAIRDLGDEYVALHGTPGKVGFHEQSTENHAKRRCQVGWLHKPAQDPRLTPVYDRLGEIVQDANGQFWRYDISGFHDLLQYVVYRGAGEGAGDHFAFHQDRGDDWRRPQRKLAVVAILSDPDEYEGGEFQIFDGEPHTVKARQPGDVYVFPSFIQHRVLPVMRGERRTLVGWLCGEHPFR